MGASISDQVLNSAGMFVGFSVGLIAGAVALGVVLLSYRRMRHAYLAGDYTVKVA